METYRFKKFLHSNFASILNEFGVDLGSIWVDLGSREDLRWLWSPLERPRSNFDRFQIDLGPLMGPSRPQFGGLDASWGVLWLSLGSRESFHVRSHFRSIFGLHFASILDPKTTPKSLTNQTKSFAKTKKEKRLISMLLPLKFQEILMLKPKRSIFKNYAKT